LPNPGLLPTAKELAAQQEQVHQAVTAIEQHGQAGWGQVAATRRAARTIAQVARARGVGQVVLCEPAAPRWRRAVEGDPMKSIQRRLGSGVSVSQVS
jgi:K+-sensing histidine kinase KdpD